MNSTCGVVGVAGLGSVLFAINLDRPELNTIQSPTGLDALFTRSSIAKPITAQSPVEVDISPVVSSPGIFCILT
jgi:hypothetical protein